VAEAAMAASKQDVLREAWLGGREGYLSGMEEARAWALREVWRDEGKSSYGMLVHIAGKVYKTSSKKKKEHPTPSALSQLFDRVDADKDWFPGKNDQEQHGPAPALSGTNQTLVARSAMAMKERGEEPTYAKLVASNPKASCNPGTERPVDKKVVYNVLRKRCYDDPNDKSDTWTNSTRCSKNALTEKQIVARHAWAKWMKAKPHSATWYYEKLIWTDICNTILPRTLKKHEEQILARKSKKGWGSKKTKLKSRNLKGNVAATKQKSYDSIRVWWAPVLMRGKLHIEVLGQEFPGDKAAGAAILVSKVRSAVNIRFQSADKPSVLFVDRGQGFFANNNGKITKDFKTALQENALKTFNGDDGSMQPGRLQELMLHETAVSWIRVRENSTRPPNAWEETPAQLGTRLREICKDINDNLDVEGLCRALPCRLDKLDNAKGDRINH
jgi:hypothetical protein